MNTCCNESVYNVGTTVNLTGTFKDSNGVLYDPAEVSASVKNSAGAQSYAMPPIIRVSQGVYQFSYLIAVYGDHWWQFHGQTTGEGSVTEQKRFKVPVSRAV